MTYTGLLGCWLLLSGCEDFIKQFMPVDPTDSGVTFWDASTDSDLTIPDVFSLTGASPSHGPFTGGTEVTLSGAMFDKGLAVTVGGKKVQDSQIKILSPIAARIVTPAGKVGQADIQVSLGGDSAALKGGFTYDPVSLNPPSGPVAGGTLVTILGTGTNFTSTMKLELGGKPMTGVEVISSTLLRAKTPRGSSTGPVDLVFSEKGDRTIKGAFSYYYSSNPKTGGMGGDPIKGTLTVTVLNWLSRAPLADAVVVLQKQRAAAIPRKTDKKGMAVYTDSKLTGPVTVTAGKAGHETSTIVSFDARDLTIFLMPIAKPQPGPMPPGSMAGAVKGFVLFGGITGAGSPKWKLVPEPKSGQTKRAYVYTSRPSVAWGIPTPTSEATIDYVDDGTTAWPYRIVGYTGAFAVYAVAGLYTKSTNTFEPYAMGVKRGVLVGPAETVTADVWINIPLSEKLKIKIKDAPAEVHKHAITLAVDLGADGLIMLDPWDIAGDGIPAQAVIARLPSFNHPDLIDASYTLDAMLESNAESGLPMARASERSIKPKAGALLLDKFVGVPHQVKPTLGGSLAGNTISWTQSGSAHNLSVTIIRQTDETPIWRIISPGRVSHVQLPAPATFGLAAWPTGPVIWLQWLARIPSFNYDTFNYGNLSSRYWKRWSFDELGFKVP